MPGAGIGVGWRRERRRAKTRSASCSAGRGDPRDGSQGDICRHRPVCAHGLSERLSMNRYGSTRAPARHHEGAHMNLGRRKLRLAAAAATAAVALIAAGCPSSGTSSSGGSRAVSLNNGLQGLNPGTGTPKSGGTLNLLGTGDVDFMDYNISYYT